MLKRNRFFAIVVALFPLACGPATEHRSEIHGEVTLDGEPIQAGAILFLPTDPTRSATAGAEIKNGRYSIERDKGPGVGLYRVEIRASKKSGKQVQKAMGQPGELMDEMVEAVATRFNAQSELTFDVKLGVNTANFTAASK